jgi:hypothetical protein
MIKSIALLALIATPFLAHAQVDDPQAADVASAASTQTLVTYDLTGTFPANMPVTRLTAPNAAFVIEISFPQTVPATTNSTLNFRGNAVSGSYFFAGHLYRATSGYFFVAAHDLNSHGLSLSTAAGTVSFYTRGINPDPSIGLPFNVYRPVATSENQYPQGSVTFLPGDVGAQPLPWPLTFTNLRGQQIASPVKITDIVGRVVVPQSRPLATR